VRLNAYDPNFFYQTDLKDIAEGIVAQHDPAYDTR
jgi:hypothetical protein